MSSRPSRDKSERSISLDARPNPSFKRDPPQQAAHGLHFILGQAHPAAAVRLSQTLGRNQVLPNKVCPVVFRRAGSVIEVLAFEHPLAGFQLVKGTIESGESIEVAALRELAEESGIEAAVVTQNLGIWSSGFEGQVWAFVECKPSQACPESWVHHAPDDGGHAFRFFWHPLFGSMNSDRWHSLFQGALGFIQNAA